MVFPCSQSFRSKRSVKGQESVGSLPKRRRGEGQRKVSEEAERQRRRNEKAFDRWLKQKRQQALDEQARKKAEKDVQMHSQWKNIDHRAYSKWLKSKAGYFNSLKKRKDRVKTDPVGNESAGKKDEIDTGEDSETSSKASRSSLREYTLAYRKWLESKETQETLAKTNEEISETPIDIMERKTHERRNKMILNGMRYRDWLKQKYCEDKLAQKILLANKLELDRERRKIKRARAPRQIDFLKWLQLINERKQRDLVKREEERARQKREEEIQHFLVQGCRKTFEEWCSSKRLEEAVDSVAEANKTNAFYSKERQKRANQAYQAWVIGKEYLQLKIEQALLREERLRLQEVRQRRRTLNST